MNSKFYAQAGEDVVLARLLPSPVGVFAEIGCIDGLRFSNTYQFEQKGLCVEAHADYIPLLKRNRPASVVVHAAVADSGEVVFYANKRGSLSTLDPSKETEFRERYSPWFHGFTTQHVPLRALSSIIDEIGLPALDFISIDVEGSELNVLRGLDLTRHRPRIMIIEADSPADLAQLTAHLNHQYYRLLGSVANNAFFAEYNFAVPANFDQQPFRASLCHTPHPLDAQVEHCTEFEVAWRPIK